MNVEFKTLDNGITIINDQIDVESASIGVWIGAGSSNENNDECGIAHMLEHMAFKGTKNRNAEKFNVLGQLESLQRIKKSGELLSNEEKEKLNHEKSET